MHQPAAAFFVTILQITLNGVTLPVYARVHLVYQSASMKNHLLLTLSSFLVLIVGTAAARTGGLTGRVVDPDGKPVPDAGIYLLRATDSAFVQSGLTNEKGEYQLTPLPDGAYLVKVVLAGYKMQSSAQNIIGNNVTAPDITLQPYGAELKEVSVTAAKPFIEVHPDKLVLNVENSIVSAGSSVLDVLQHSPGVKVDDNDNISLKGKQGVNVMIDGRIVPVSSADLANMLRSMPSGSVDKIEIISNPSAKYDAAGTAGIINIITKHSTGTGINGSINTSYAQGRYPKENTGFTFNYRHNKLSIYTNYNSDYRVGFSHVDWTRQYFDGPAYTGADVQTNYSVLTFHTNTAAAGIDYSLSQKTTIGISATGENFFLGVRGYYYAKVMAPDNTLQSVFATNNSSASNWNNYAPNIHLRHVFDSSGKELNIDADYGRYWNVNTQDFTTRYYAPDGTEYLQPYVLHGDIAGSTQIRSLKTDYSEPLPNDAHVDAGFKFSYVTADNEPKFFNRSNNGNVYDSTKSDHFLYNENIAALYLDTRKDWAKWAAQLGVRAEQTMVSGEEKVTSQSFSSGYLQLFPSFAVQRHMDKDNDLGITLSRRIERPSYNDLNPYKFFVDPSTYKEGNPYLVPALTYAAELSHTYKQRLITTLSLSQTTDVITEVIKPSTTQDRVTIQTKDNLATMNYVGISGAYTIPILKWWTSINNIDAYYAQYRGNLSNTSINKAMPTFDINTSNKFTLPADWSAELSFFYQSAQVYGVLNLTPVNMLNFGLQKNLLKKQLTIRANVNDIFRRGNHSGSSDFVNYRESFVALHDTRQAAIAVTWRFGSKESAVRKHSTGAEEEKRRAEQTG